MLAEGGIMFLLQMSREKSEQNSASKNGKCLTSVSRTKIAHLFSRDKKMCFFVGTNHFFRSF